jgi:hypothetical protein
MGFASLASKRSLFLEPQPWQRFTEEKVVAANTGTNQTAGAITAAALVVAVAGGGSQPNIP